MSISRMNVVLLFALLSAVALAPRAAAQSTFKLDESGDWIETPAPSLGEDAATMNEVRRLIAEGRAGLAYDIVNDWIDRHEDQTVPQSPAAYRLRGDALTALGKEFKALFDYERVARAFPQSEEFPIAVEREFDIAMRYLEGLRVKLLGLRVEDATDIGIELLLRTHERMPGSELGERAAIAVADHYYDIRDMRWAVDAYDAYLASYPNGPNREKALKRRVIGNLARYRGAQYDATSLLDARRQIAQLQRELPLEAERLELDERMITMIDAALAAQTLEAANWRLKRGEPHAARFLLLRVIEQRPGADAAKEAERMLLERGWIQPSTLDAIAPEESDGDEVRTDEGSDG